MTESVSTEAVVATAATKAVYGSSAATIVLGLTVGEWAALIWSWRHAGDLCREPLVWYEAGCPRARTSPETDESPGPQNADKSFEVVVRRKPCVFNVQLGAQNALCKLFQT